MNQGYSLRAAAKIVGIAHTTFDSYKKRGIVTPDVADKKGEFSLFSEAQIELAKAYRAANPPKTKKQNPGNTSDNLFDEHAPNETIAAALVDRNSPADEQSISSFEDTPTSPQEPRECASEGVDDIQPDLPENPYAAIDLPDNQGEVDSGVGDNDLEEKNTPAPVNDEDAPFEESDTFSFAEQNDTCGDSSGDNRLINTGEEYGVGDDDNTPPKNSKATISQPANDEDAFKLDDPAEFNRASDDEHENQNVVGAPAPVARKLTVDEARALGLTYEEFMANQKGMTVEEYLESQRKQNLPAVASEVTVESPPFFDNSVALLEEKTLQELADEGRDFFSRGDDCLKRGALYYVEGGRRLVEAKRRLKHGQWQEWLKANFSFSQDTAANYMKLAERFGGARSEMFRIFKPAVLIKMLALPVGDEDAFIEAQAAAGKPVEDLTAREVRKAVKEWKTHGSEPPADEQSISSFEDTPTSPQEPRECASEGAGEGEDTPAKKPLICLNTGSVEWYTPHEYIEAARSVLARIDLDPASSAIANETVKAERFFSSEGNGLIQEWRGRIWLNPPYARELISKFVDKLLEEYAHGNVAAAIVLTDSSTETRWFTKLAQKSSAICFATRRIKFLHPDGSVGNGSPTRGSAFFYLGDEVEKFFEFFQQFGWFAKHEHP